MHGSRRGPHPTFVSMESHGHAETGHDCCGLHIGTRRRGGMLAVAVRTGGDGNGDAAVRLGLVGVVFLFAANANRPRKANKQTISTVIAAPDDCAK
jgi:hypothetical protein